jgi:hypothetical protein
MPLEELRDALGRQPFISMRLHLSDGRTFDLFHQEMAWVGRHFVVVGVRGPDGYLEHHDTIALVHVVRIEPLPPAPPDAAAPQQQAG